MPYSHWGSPHEIQSLDTVSICMISGVNQSLLVGIGARRPTAAEVPVWDEVLILEITTDIQVQGEISLLSLSQAVIIIACPVLVA